MFSKTTKSNSGNCVEIEQTDDGFRFTSDIEGNDGAVTYTAAEVVSFIEDVKAGRWDTLHVVARAARLAQSETVTA